MAVVEVADLQVPKAGVRELAQSVSVLAELVLEMAPEEVGAQSHIGVEPAVPAVARQNHPCPAWVVENQEI
jgi:hypothetical protein